MNVKRAAIALALISIVLVSFAALMYQQKIFKFAVAHDPTHRLQIHSSISSYNAITIDEYCIFAFTPSINVQTINGQAAIANATRDRIVDYVRINPGVQFRAICSSLCLPIGLAQYHLGVLIKSGLVSFVRDGRYKRFFISGRFSKQQMAAICLLRHRTARRIIEALMCKHQISHGRLAGEVSITSQALSWQMKSICTSEFILQTNDGLRVVYQLDKSAMSQLRTYLAIIN